MNYEELILGRQPILTRDGFTHGYELLFRNPGESSAVIADNTSATARVLVNMVQNFGLEKLLGGKDGFININENILMQDILDVLPPENLVFEIIENTVVSKALIERIRKYREKGYRFALDDLFFSDEYMLMFTPLFPLTDYIKVDFTLSSDNDIRYKTRELKKYPAKLLAEKVETQESYTMALDAGFELFQGYYFARPNIISKSAIEPSKLSILKLLNLLGSDSTLDKIETEFKLQPEFSLKLLKMINSSSFFIRSEVRSIRHAISLLGRQQLQKWLIIMLYASKNKENRRSPLLETVLLRARAMELLAARVYGENSGIAGDAYFTGLISMLDAIFGISASELMSSLNIEGTIKDAIEKREGRLGRLLRLIETSDDRSAAVNRELLAEFRLTVNEVSEIKYASFEWMAEQQVLQGS
ncbi:EAL domain-containing protein [Geovibrio thiophilus]|uniref:EAL domain-containing protein n=1 Tax=Geovibrio thiophilus TaxID=139438 RepID=A0A3R5V0C4_9BACT|nr:EAL domain-containing protein [Geovibrio thiophilus]QAR32561.1 EAL domain-containing protein [Geovibrio thiophilus]